MTICSLMRYFKFKIIIKQCSCFSRFLILKLCSWFLMNKINTSLHTNFGITIQKRYENFKTPYFEKEFSDQFGIIFGKVVCYVLKLSEKIMQKYSQFPIIFFWRKSFFFQNRLFYIFMCFRGPKVPTSYKHFYFDEVLIFFE